MSLPNDFSQPGVMEDYLRRSTTEDTKAFRTTQIWKGDMTSIMPIYNQSGVCPKCGHDGIGTLYCTDTWLNDFVQKPHAALTDGAEEHLDRWCNNCSFRWVESPLDAKGT